MRRLRLVHLHVPPDDPSSRTCIVRMTRRRPRPLSAAVIACTWRLEFMGKALSRAGVYAQLPRPLALDQRPVVSGLSRTGERLEFVRSAESTAERATGDAVQ
jgi:hypothetical protein